MNYGITIVIKPKVEQNIITSFQSVFVIRQIQSICEFENQARNRSIYTEGCGLEQQNHNTDYSIE